MNRWGPSPHLRLGVLGIFVVSLFAVMFARLWYLQVLDSPTAVAASERNRVRLVPTEAPRGRILDRHGRVLVDNRVSNVVTVSRALVEDRSEVLARLAALLGRPVGDLEARMADRRHSPYKPVPVAEDVPESVLVYLSEHQELFPGVQASQVAQRSYPHGTLGAHLLGYIGEVNDRELAERRGQGYRLGDSVGKAGIEMIYEDVLRGRAGIEKLEVDSHGKVLRTLGEQPPVQGHDVVLTVDLEVQKLAEESLAQGLAAARSRHDRNTGTTFAAPAGAVVVLDPRNGSVLALASNPTYDPASFLGGIRPEVFATMQDPASYFPLNNRVTQGQYAPGSTFKLVTSIAALKSGVVTPRTTIVDRGALRVGNRTFRNAGSRAYGPVALSRAITVSSDVYYYTIGAQLWAKRAQLGDAIQDAARQLGFGDATGIPLAPEAGGRVPDPESRRRLHEQNPKAFPEGRWYPGDNVNLSIGQGELVVTPLQLANAYATFANGGTVYAPRVASAVKDRDGGTVRTVEPVVTRRVDLPPEMRDPIMTGLVGAVADPGGTARAAFAGFPLDRLQVAGKTGTAQVRGKQDTALFVAVAPAAAPEYVVAVVMEEAGFGGSAAAPVARRVLQGIAGDAPPSVSLASGVD